MLFVSLDSIFLMFYNFFYNTSCDKRPRNVLYCILCCWPAIQVNKICKLFNKFRVRFYTFFTHRACGPARLVIHWSLQKFTRLPLYEYPKKQQVHCTSGSKIDPCKLKNVELEQLFLINALGLCCFASAYFV